MNFLEERILKDGALYPGNIIKVDRFLNHLIDIDLSEQIADEIIRRFEGKKITKVLTIEASGISLATVIALKLHVPLAFAKKKITLNVAGDDFYTAEAFSFTHQVTNTVAVAKFCLDSDDRVLIVDDFLAAGSAMRSLCDIVKQAGATLVGCSAMVEKGFQGGGDDLRKSGIQVESVAIIESIDYDTESITFRN